MDVKNIQNFSNKFWKINKTKGHSKHHVYGKLPVSASSEAQLAFEKLKTWETACWFFIRRHTRTRAHGRVNDVYRVRCGIVCDSARGRHGETTGKHSDPPRTPVYRRVFVCNIIGVYTHALCSLYTKFNLYVKDKT